MKISFPPTFIREVNVVIQHNLDKEYFSTEQLAELLNLSSSQVYRKIKQHTGHSPSTYIRLQRLDKSLHFIEQTDMTLSEIAYEVGFSCLSYYSRCFSEYYGFPPSNMRKT